MPPDRPGVALHCLPQIPWPPRVGDMVSVKGTGDFGEVTAIEGEGDAAFYAIDIFPSPPTRFRARRRPPTSDRCTPLTSWNQTYSAPRCPEVSRWTMYSQSATT